MLWAQTVKKLFFIPNNTWGNYWNVNLCILTVCLHLRNNFSPEFYVYEIINTLYVIFLENIADSIFFIV